MIESKVVELLRLEFRALRGYRPGLPIAIADICDRFGVSHVPVREALSKLAEEGLVEHIYRRGFFMRSVDEQSVLESFDCLQLTIAYAFDRILRNGSAFAMRPMWAGLLERTKRRIDCEGGDAIVEVVVSEILRHTGNRHLSHAGLRALGQIQFIVVATNADTSRRAALQRSVEMALECMVRGRPGLAKRSVRHIFEYARDHVTSTTTIALEAIRSTAFGN